MMIDNFRLKYTFFNIILVLTLSVQSQSNMDWWNEAHNWDGYTHWTDYIIYSAYYLGPNALPVPESQKGLLRQKTELESEYLYHYSRGDKTHCFQLSLYYPIIKNKIALEFYGVPYESYAMNYETVLERRSRFKDGQGTAIGDFYFATIIQILKNPAYPEVAFRMACRTASGSQLANARYTDAPGYFFDLSFGKDLLFDQTKKYKIRLSGMLGFYSWQMNLPNNRQNDAILYGVGADMGFCTWYINTALDGYWGYLGNEPVVAGNAESPVPFRDRPMILRFECGKEYERVKVFAGYQTGLYDFLYDTFRVGLSFYLIKD
ncbi:MAG: hypothetical protein K9G76_12675 [Bacteroidales bacterium]|nr:hypothetical protein [Bacteroidales bacterium]MCF8405392.1 hypothetical protein [Bacteroidales bacterium]